MAIRVIKEKCIGCGACAKACPFDAVDIIDKKASINDKCRACGACVEKCPVKAIVKEENGARGVNIDEYKGVWVFAEQRDGKLQGVAIELLGEGRKIADELGTELSAILLGHNVDDLAEELIKYGADKVI